MGWKGETSQIYQAGQYSGVDVDIIARDRLLFQQKGSGRRGGSSWRNRKRLDRLGYF